ncbi:hypothetical protein NGM33_26830 [Nocardiopsis dassonvillei]|uniref:hypothetical protein n=1 Tax=Nocardiopsis dassonvillei TaxID=2014 RepID=UPI0020A33809|nr:hypothetical protein [Nocardiopsis dassonvillei]MCP3016953.1 hypothetical protein [Nocardiopsis dassonvillei]
MTDTRYRGSGPYCYSSCLIMMLGGDAPDIAVVETVTGSPFGVQLEDGLAFFDPCGWNPETGVDEALTALGWTARTTSGGDADTAFGRLNAALADGPVMVGPVEMGHLRHQPGMTGPVGADHYVVVLGADDAHVTLHDPQGYPYARLPRADFTAAWRAESVAYAEPYTMRTEFARARPVDTLQAVDAAVPRAIDWLGGANADAALALADLVERGCGRELRGHLVDFAVRVGARRLADAAACLHRVGHTAAAATLTGQARLVGSLQHPLVTGDDGAAAAVLRELAPAYGVLRDQLAGSRKREGATPVRTGTV